MCIDRYNSIHDARKSYFDKDIIKKDKNGNIISVTLRQSLIKALMFKGDKKNYCPKRIKYTYVYPYFNDIPSFSMLKGLLFESLCLGKTAGEQMWVDMPKNKNGSLKQDEIRIRKQADLFKSSVIDKFGLIVNENNVQIPALKEWKEHPFDFKVMISGRADLISPVIYNDTKYPAACIDLKLTGDLNNKQGSFCWGSPHNMDHTQAYLYTLLFDMPFFYLVFDYKPIPEHKIFKVNFDMYSSIPRIMHESKMRYNELKENIRKAVMILLEHENAGYALDPGVNCNYCPLRLMKLCNAEMKINKFEDL